MLYIEIWKENLPNMLEVSREVTEMTKIKRRKGGWVISCVQGNKVSICLQIKTYTNNHVNQL